MTGIHPINALFSFLADLYCQEGRSEANETALALREAAQNGPKEWLLQPNPKPGLAQAAFQHAPHENAQTVINALPFIRWLDVADSISNLKSERAEKMLVCELLGPTGMVKDARFRVGLYMQELGFLYPTRTHMADETYILLGGSSYWGTYDNIPVKHETGAIIHHPSMIPHHNLTKTKPMIATWRWSGDISFDTYRTA